MTTFHPDQSGLRDNHTRGTVADFLHEQIRDGSALSIVSAYFTIYAYDALKSVLDQIEHLDFLFGEPSFVNRLHPNKTEKKSFLMDDDGLRLANRLQQKRVARQCAAWIEAKVDIKTARQSNLLHGEMYHPTSFLRDDLPPELRAAYEDKIHGGFTQEGRERILIAMMKVNFLKRLESSVDSFRLTLQRTIDKIDRLEQKISDFETHVDDNPEMNFDALKPEQFEDPDFEEDEFTIGGRRRIHLGHLKLPEWLKEVRNDRTQLQYLLEKTKSVTPDRDGKLAELKTLLAAKARQPTTNRDGEANRKVLVFTAFADTARYLYQYAGDWAQNELNVHTALVCGDGGNATTLGRTDYADFLTGLKERIRHARTTATRVVNRELILLYWDIGCAIVEKQQAARWGGAVVERLASDLRAEFPDMRGFSGRNLREMKRFWLAYSDPEFWQQAVAKLGETEAETQFWQHPVAKMASTDTAAREILAQPVPETELLRQLVAEIPWGQHMLILSKLEDPAARLFYLRATAQFGWSRRVLLNQIKAGAYERAVKEKKTHNFPLALPEHLAEQADEMMKSRYNLEFLGIGQAIKERDLENRLRAQDQSQPHRRG